MDHAPDRAPVFHVPLTIVRAAVSNSSTNRAFASRSIVDVHVPVYSPARPVTFARQEPAHRAGDFAAAHPP
jgi:hypothetical protein